MPADNVLDELPEMSERSITNLLTELLHRSELNIDFVNMRCISTGAQGAIYLTKAYSLQEDDESLVPKIGMHDVVLKGLHKDPTAAFSAHLELTDLIESTAHKNIIKIIGVVTHEGHQYAVLPYCETFLDREIDKFHQLLLTDPVAHAAMVISFLKDTLNALTYMHARHFVHSDIKPANIAFCARHGAFALSDIDSAESTQKNADRAETFPGVVQGTAEFMHPRIIVHPEEVALPYNDTYGLGKTLLFLIDPQAVQASKLEREKFNHPIAYYYFRGRQYKEPTITDLPLPAEFSVPTSHDIKDIQAHLHGIADRMMELNVSNMPNLEELKEHCDKVLDHIKQIDAIHNTHSIPLKRRLHRFVQNMIISSPKQENGKDTHSAQSKIPCPSEPSSVASSLSRRPSPRPPPAAAVAAVDPELTGAGFFAVRSRELANNRRAAGVYPHAPTRHPLKLLPVRDGLSKRSSSVPPKPSAVQPDKDVVDMPNSVSIYKK